MASYIILFFHVSLPPSVALYIILFSPVSPSKCGQLPLKAISKFRYKITEILNVSLFSVRESGGWVSVGININCYFSMRMVALNLVPFYQSFAAPVRPAMSVTNIFYLVVHSFLNNFKWCCMLSCSASLALRSLAYVLHIEKLVAEIPGEELALSEFSP